VSGKLIPVSILNQKLENLFPNELFILNTYLVILTLFYYLPIRVFDIIKREAIKQNESNFNKAASIGFGVFMGIVPIWGFQLMIGIPLAILLKLNKVLFVTSANISIPPAIPFIIFLSYLCGAPFFKSNIQITSLNNLTLASINLNFLQYVVGAVILALIAGSIAFLITLTLLSKFRKKK